MECWSSGRRRHRWVGTGRVVYDNKGNAVKAYEPFFDSSHAYDDEPELVEWGVTAMTRYDPLARVISDRQPERDATARSSWTRWQHLHFRRERHSSLRAPGTPPGAADQLGPTKHDAAAKAATHAGTPADHRCSTRSAGSAAPWQDNGPGGQYSRPSLALDIEGNVRSVTDALGRADPHQRLQPARHRDPPPQRRRRRALDSCGRRRAAAAAWDSRGTQSSHDYDRLRRPAARSRRCRAGDPSRVAEQITYGESLARRAEPATCAAPPTSTATRPVSPRPASGTSRATSVVQPAGCSSRTSPAASTGPGRRPWTASVLHHGHDLRRAQPAGHGHGSRMTA